MWSGPVCPNWTSCLVGQIEQIEKFNIAMLKYNQELHKSNSNSNSSQSTSSNNSSLFPPLTLGPSSSSSSSASTPSSSSKSTSFQQLQQPKLSYADVKNIDNIRALKQQRLQLQKQQEPKNDNIDVASLLRSASSTPSTTTSASASNPANTPSSSSAASAEDTPDHVLALQTQFATTPIPHSMRIYLVTHEKQEVYEAVKLAMGEAYDREMEEERRKQEKELQQQQRDKQSSQQSNRDDSSAANQQSTVNVEGSSTDVSSATSPTSSSTSPPFPLPTYTSPPPQTINVGGTVYNVPPRPALLDAWREVPKEDIPRAEVLFPFAMLLNNNNSNNIASSPSSSPSSSPTLSPAASPSLPAFSSLSEYHNFRSTGSTSCALYWNLLWTWKKPTIDWYKLLAWQKVNHFPDSRVLTRKDLLKKQIDKYTQHKGYKYAQQFQVMPQSFILPSEWNSFVECFLSYQSQLESDIERGVQGVEALNYWICKPPSLSRGRGITLISSIHAVSHCEPAVIQRYIASPLLLKGYKFDLRLYVLVTSFAPLECFLYNEGFARLSTVPFNLSPNLLANKFIHLTNSSIQRGSVPPEFARQFRDPLGDGGSKISLSYWRELLKQMNIDVAAVWSNIERVIIKTLLCVEDDVPQCVNSFEVFGFDVLIDTSMRAWLIEVNASPSMGLDTPLDNIIKPKMIRDTINLVDPLPFNRAYLSHLLERRLATGLFEFSAPKSKVDRDLHADSILYFLLNQRVPRQVGEMPKRMGNYTRLAPSKEYENIMKMKRAAFQPATTMEGKYKRTLPNMV